MKLRNITDDEVLLEVRTTGKEIKEVFLPKESLHYWYPFNINFKYNYTDSKQFLYLVKEKDYEGKNYYNVDILKRTKALPQKNGIMFNEPVFLRNMYIISKAMSLGIPTILDVYTLADVELGFSALSNCIQVVKERAEDTYLQAGGEPFYSQIGRSEEWDELVYKHMSPEEREILIELGEIYAMLTVMRKLAE